MPDHVTTPTETAKMSSKSKKNKTPKGSKRPKTSSTRSRPRSDARRRSRQADSRAATNMPAKKDTETGKSTPRLRLDEDTANALTLFNTYLKVDHEIQKHERAIKKAEKVKADAAAEVRKLNSRKASSADIAPAEAAYREAVNALNQLKQGEHTKAG